MKEESDRVTFHCDRCHNRRMLYRVIHEFLMNDEKQELILHKDKPQRPVSTHRYKPIDIPIPDHVLDEFGR